MEQQLTPTLEINNITDYLMFTSIYILSNYYYTNCTTLLQLRYLHTYLSDSSRYLYKTLTQIIGDNIFLLVFRFLTTICIYAYTRGGQIMTASTTKPRIDFTRVGNFYQISIKYIFNISRYYLIMLHKTLELFSSITYIPVTYLSVQLLLSTSKPPLR